MKLVEELMEALLRQHDANQEVVRLMAEIEAKVDGRKQRRKPRKKRATKAAP